MALCYKSPPCTFPTLSGQFSHHPISSPATLNSTKSLFILATTIRRKAWFVSQHAQARIPLSGVMNIKVSGSPLHASIPTRLHPSISTPFRHFFHLNPPFHPPRNFLTPSSCGTNVLAIQVLPCSTNSITTFWVSRNLRPTTQKAPLIASRVCLEK